MPVAWRQGWKVGLGIALAWGLACGSGDPQAEAQARLDAGQPLEAIEILRSALEADPDDADANHKLAVALLSVGDSSRAIPRLQRSLESPAHAAEATRLLTLALFAGGNYGEAIAAASRGLRSQPEDVELLRLRANAHLRAGDAVACARDADSVAEFAPDDPASWILIGTCRAQAGAPDAEAALERAVRVAENADDAARGNACGALADFYATSLEDLERAGLEYERCLEATPDHTVLLQAATRFFIQAGQPQRARSALGRAVAARPDDLRLAASWALHRVREGEAEAGLSDLRATAERLDSAEAWAVLGQIQRQLGDSAAAVTSFEAALARADGDNDALRFTLADALVDLGRHDEALQRAATLQPAVYGHLIRGRVLLEQGDAVAALAAFDEGLQSWPNNAGARFLAGQAAERSGQLPRALSEYRESSRAEPAASDAGLHAARVALALGQADEAIAFAQRHAANRANRLGETAVIAAQALALKGDPAAGAEALGAWVDRQGVDPITLRALAQLELDSGAAPRALQRVDAAIAADPDVADYHDVRGRVLAALDRPQEAEASLARALELQPGHAGALAARGELWIAAGRVDDGLAQLEAAADAAGGALALRYRAAQVALASGRRDDARRRLDAILASSPTHAPAANDLAWLLAEEGEDLDRALALAEMASAHVQSAAFLDTLGWVHLARGDTQQAVQILSRASALAPESEGIQEHLERARARQAAER